MKNLGLILSIVILLMMSSCGVSTPLLAQNQKISIEKTKLAELTKQAEKGQFLEGENVNLIVENHRLKQVGSKQVEQIEKLEEDVKKYKKAVTIALVGLISCFVAIVFLLRFLLK